jgi:hypothetical protein
MAQLPKLSLLVLLFPVFTSAQKSPAVSAATINVSVTNSKKAPIGNEEVLFV